MLLDAPEFDNGLGLKVHVRTRLEGWYSSVDVVAVKIGEDILEITSGFGDLSYWFNGEEGTSKGKLGGDIPFTVGGNEVRFHLMEAYKSFQYTIVLGEKGADQTHLMIRSVKGNLRVTVDHPTAAHFSSARGLMGSYAVAGSSASIKRARNGLTIIDDANDFGNEWQVHPEEDSMLFHNVTGPQHPKQQCFMPNAASVHRRLAGDGSVTYDQAVTACAHLQSDDRSDCVTDVIALGDLDVAQVY